MAPTATSTFTHQGGRARVACEKTVPAATSTMAPTAVVQAISPRDAQAAIATSTAPRQATRSRTESSGTPAGWPAGRRRGRSRAGAAAGHAPAHGAGQPAPGAPPVGHGPDDGTRGLPGPEQDRAPALRAGRTTEPSAPSATRSAASGSAGSSHRDGHGLGRRPLHLAHHEAAGVGGRAPVDQAPGVTGHVRTGAAGQPRVGTGPVEQVARPLLGPQGGRLRPGHSGATRGAPRAAAAAPASSTTAARTARPRRCRA